MNLYFCRYRDDLTASEKQPDLPLHNGCGMAPVRWSCHTAMLKLHVSTFLDTQMEKFVTQSFTNVWVKHSNFESGFFILTAISLERCEICSPAFLGTSKPSQCESRIKLSADRELIWRIASYLCQQLDCEDSNQRSKLLFRSVHSGKTESTILSAFSSLKKLAGTTKNGCLCWEVRKFWHHCGLCSCHEGECVMEKTMLNYMIYRGLRVVPFPVMVANEGFVRDPLVKIVTILVRTVTGKGWEGGQPKIYHQNRSWGKQCCEI